MSVEKLKDLKNWSEKTKMKFNSTKLSPRMGLILRISAVGWQLLQRTEVKGSGLLVHPRRVTNVTWP